jgi:cytochrome c oxidase subunit IV
MDEIDHMDESELDDIMKQNGTLWLKLTTWMMLDHVNDANEELDRVDVFTLIEFVQWTRIIIWMKLNGTHEMHDSNEMDSMVETK